MFPSPFGAKVSESFSPYERSCPKAGGLVSIPFRGKGIGKQNVFVAPAATKSFHPLSGQRYRKGTLGQTKQEAQKFPSPFGAKVSERKLVKSQ